jgi:hypothetical protein
MGEGGDEGLGWYITVAGELGETNMSTFLKFNRRF